MTALVERLGEGCADFVSDVGRGVSNHTSKVALSCLALAIFILGMSTAAGALTKAGPLGGLALGGFTTLVFIPVAIGTVLTGIVGGGIGCSILGGVGGACKGDPVEGCTNGAGFGAVVGLVAGIIAIIFIVYLVGTAICNKISSVPSFTYGESLKVFGHLIWMQIGLAIIGGCCVAAANRR